MPRRAVALGAGLLAFLTVVLSIAAWARFSGSAGTQRGLVIHSYIARPVTVVLEDGRRIALTPADRESTSVVERDQFPQTVRVEEADGRGLLEQRLEYKDLVDAEFRLALDERGFYPISELRDTPRATP